MATVQKDTYTSEPTEAVNFPISEAYSTETIDDTGESYH